LNTASTQASWCFKSVDRPTGLGRFPANVIHDGSEAVVKHLRIEGRSNASAPTSADDGDVSAARFFYAAKASSKDRDEGLDGFARRLSPFFQTANGTSGEASPMGAQKNGT